MFGYGGTSAGIREDGKSLRSVSHSHHGARTSAAGGLLQYLKSMAARLYFSSYALYAYVVVLALNALVLILTLGLAFNLCGETAAQTNSSIRSSSSADSSSGDGTEAPPQHIRSSSSSRHSGSSLHRLVHALEFLLTCLLLVEVFLRLLLTGSVSRYLRSWENVFDFFVAGMCVLFLLGYFFENLESQLEALFGESLVFVRTFLRLARVWIFVKRHTQKASVLEDEVDFVALGNRGGGSSYNGFHGYNGGSGDETTPIFVRINHKDVD